MAEELIPAGQLAVNDRMWMGGEQLWATVTAIINDPQGVTVTVSYDQHTQPVTFTRSRDFRILVDRTPPGGSMMTRIPALTLWRPWPALIMSRGKDVENRQWATGYRGPLLIHAGERFQHGIEATGFRVDGAAVEWVSLSTDPDDYPTGIIGVVDLVDVCPCKRLGGCSVWAMPDEYHWQLANPRSFPELVDCPGRQRLWWPSGEVAELVADQLAKVGA